MHTLNELVRKWNNKIGHALGLRLEPHLLILFATTLVILIQILLFVLFSARSADCSSLGPDIAKADERLSVETLPVIYIITPTYARAVQRAELTRLSQIFMLVPKLHWIIVEDSVNSTAMVKSFVSRLQTKFKFRSITLLSAPTPREFKLKPGDPEWKFPKGVWQRNTALGWLRQNQKNLDTRGIVYFADDDNTYDLEIFDEIRSTKNVSVWPVGLVGGLLVERPIVAVDGATNKSRVIGFNARWEPNRRFPVDMAGFALSVGMLLKHPNAVFSSYERVGYMESHFLSQFIDSPAELEPKANNCKRTLVWHTKTKNPSLYAERRLKEPSNSDMDF
jgi:galactosylgalactosylxylosylprotein 3-beta-glucuronosyltransferase 3